MSKFYTDEQLTNLIEHKEKLKEIFLKGDLLECGIYYRRETDPKDSPVYMVVDGDQPLVTMFILDDLTALSPDKASK